MTGPTRIDAPWEIKVWGRVQHIFYDDEVGISHLEVVKGYRCSKHYHVERSNLFCVQTGRVEIVVWVNLMPEYYRLKEGDVLLVPSGLQHEFRVLESGRMIEVYQIDGVVGVCSQDHIIRENTGGKIDDQGGSTG